MGQLVDRLRHHRRTLVRLTALVAWAHALMAALHICGRVAPAVLPAHGLTQPVALVDDRWWIGAHMVAAGVLVTAALRPGYRAGVAGASLSVAVWTVWSVLDLAWSIDTRPPVSLVAPALGLCVCAPLSALTAAAWSEHDLP